VVEALTFSTTAPGTECRSRKPWAVQQAGHSHSPVHVQEGRRHRSGLCWSATPCTPLKEYSRASRRGFAAPGQEEQMRENQGVRIVEMFSCGTIQIVKFLLAGDA